MACPNGLLTKTLDNFKPCYKLHIDTFNMKNKPLRQGDVLLIRVNKIPSDLVKTKSNTLALGEATGHHHTLFGNDVVCYAENENSLADFFEIKTEANLVHQEHDAITLPKGKYRKVIQVEYTPAGIRNVAD